jgi:hypothetical protein
MYSCPMAYATFCLADQLNALITASKHPAAAGICLLVKFSLSLCAEMSDYHDGIDFILYFNFKNKTMEL